MGTDGQPNMTKLIVAVSNFVNESKNSPLVTFTEIMPVLLRS
jgi:hypothetical protein